MKFNEKKTSCLYSVKNPEKRLTLWLKQRNKGEKKMRLLSFLVNVQKIEVSKSHPAIAISNNNFRALNKIGWANDWGKVEIIY